MINQVDLLNIAAELYTHLGHDEQIVAQSFKSGGACVGLSAYFGYLKLLDETTSPGILKEKYEDIFESMEKIRPLMHNEKALVEFINTETVNGKTILKNIEEFFGHALRLQGQQHGPIKNNPFTQDQLGQAFGLGIKTVNKISFTFKKVELMQTCSAFLQKNQIGILSNMDHGNGNGHAIVAMRIKNTMHIMNPNSVAMKFDVSNPQKAAAAFKYVEGALSPGEKEPYAISIQALNYAKHNSIKVKSIDSVDFIEKIFLQRKQIFLRSQTGNSTPTDNVDLDAMGINDQDVTGTTALFLAIDNRDHDLIRYLVLKGADLTLEKKNRKMDNVFLQAYLEGADTLDALLSACSEKGLDIDNFLSIENTAQRSILLCAIVNNDVDKMRVILKHSRDPGKLFSRTSRAGESVLFSALSKGHLDIVKMILSTCSAESLYPTLCLTHDTDDNFLRSSLMYGGGDAELVKLILDHVPKSDSLLNKKNLFNMTTLMSAARGGNTEVVKLLIDHGADINITIDGDVEDPGTGKDAITLAKEAGHDDIIVLLKKAAAPLELRKPAAERNRSVIDNTASYQAYHRYHAIVDRAEGLLSSQKSHQVQKLRALTKICVLELTDLTAKSFVQNYEKDLNKAKQLKENLSDRIDNLEKQHGWSSEDLQNANRILEKLSSQIEMHEKHKPVHTLPSSDM